MLIDEIMDRRGDPNLDVFDVLMELAYGHIPLTKTQRIENVNNSDVLSKYDGQARDVLKTLLEVYATKPEDDLADMKLLTLKEFEKYGTPVQIMRVFGGKDAYLDAVYELQKQLYAQV